jgi:tetratricopeptide (TPR) repeat protein
VAQTASVIGREFQYDTLSDVHHVSEPLNQVLTDLQRRELIRERSRLPQQIYLFKHVLTQETVYSSLLMSRRRQLHHRVAECLEHVEPDRVAEIARHYMDAREEQLALPYLVEAGDRTARAYSTSDAIGFYQRALAILESAKDPQLARRAYEGLGSALTFGKDIPAAVENYHQMFHDAQEYGDQPMQVSALNKLGFITALAQGQFPEAEKHLVEAESLAQECGDLAGLAELHMTYCYLRVPFGQFDDAVEHLGKSADIGEQLDLEEPKLFGLTHTATTLTYMTQFNEAWKAAQEAFVLAEELGNRKWQAELLTLPFSFHHLVNGDLEAVLRSAQDGAYRAAQIGAVEQEAYGALMSGQVSWMRGEYEQAIAHQQRMLEAGRASGLPFLEAAALCGLGTTYLDISPEYCEKAVELHGEALEMMDKPLGSVMGGLMWAQMGFCALAAGEPERAGEFFQKGLTVSTALKYLARPHALIGAAFVALSNNDIDEADRLVTEANSFVQEKGMKHLEPLVALGRAQVHVARGEAKGALETLAHAETLAQAMEMRPMVLQARLGSAQVLAGLGRKEDQDMKLGEARAMVEEIGGLFEDEEMRRKYLDQAAGKFA